MSDGKQGGLTDPDLWIRLVYMIVFGLLTWVSRLVILVIALVQFVVVLFSGQANRNLRILGDGIARWTCQAYGFLSFSSEQKPYPFQDWPESTLDGEQPGNSGSQPEPAQTENSPAEIESPTDDSSGPR